MNPELKGLLSDDVPLAVVVPVQAQAITPEIVGLPVDQGRWKTGLFDCFEDCNTCCAITWLMCIPLGQLWERLKEPHAQRGVCYIRPCCRVACMLVLC